jgi:D-3-phosphoglycerate dehydrogenase
MRIAVTTPTFSRTPELRAELLARFPGAVFNEAGRRLAGDELAAFLAGAVGAVIGLEPVDAALLAACPDLRMVAKHGVGLDTVDLEACRARGVAVGWSGGVNRRSVAELALCFMLGLNRNVFRVSTALRGGLWDKSGGRQLSDCTVGIVGLGCIGQDLARLLRPLGCRVLANDILDLEGLCREQGWRAVDKPTLYAEADVVSLHVPLTPLTRGLIDGEALARMKRDAFLINTARGEVVETAALKAALQAGTIAGAALDVFDPEPPVDAELLALPNLVATAHIGGNAREAVLAMGRSAIGHLERFLLGAKDGKTP